ncbi:hypothetical protein NHH03_14995 [Stieleria sp. TO1_6]|uniref:hypothetical protein n=1 Tax=Stieleria tagensis TaxID=2956795 RepID=UPI00209B8D4F|nr:hypothetical protein [Stieleria tagensis]MCO8123052.1 hypothetical protein [Stieleria tagensis]
MSSWQRYRIANTGHLIPAKPARPIRTDTSTITAADPAEPTQPSVMLSDFLAPLHQLAAAMESGATLPRAPLHDFAAAVENLGDQKAKFTVADLFWLANSWEGFGNRAQTPALASRCYRQSAAAYAFAMTIDSIALPDRNLAERRHQELSAKSIAALQLAAHPRPADSPPVSQTH